MSKIEFYAFVYKWQYEKNQGKILKGIIPPSNIKGDKRENEIKRRVKKENRLKNETKSMFWYFKIKELSLHRMLFQSDGKKQFADDVKTAYKWYILPCLDTYSEIKNISNFQDLFLETFGITKDFVNIINLPKYAIYLQIKFELKKPYLSKDDDNFYIIDNPIVKDKVFKLPMVRSTTWKGALRFATRLVCEKEKYDESIIIRLFGNEKGETKNFRQGRLFFYPTFFDRVSLDVITPLRRDTKTPARGPIYFEFVPENTTGIFRLLYYPFDLVAKGEFDKIEEEVKEDLKIVSKAIHKMFYEIGFSAKKTSVFGTAKVEETKINVGIGLESLLKQIEETFSNNFPKISVEVNNNDNC